MLLAGCATQPVAPTVVTPVGGPPAPPPPKRTAKARLASTRAVSAQTSTPTSSGTVTVSVVQTMLVYVTNASDVVSTSLTNIFKFQAPNPTLGPFEVADSADLNTWRTVYTGTGFDPVIIYELTDFNLHFYRFKVDSSQ